jgi:hypothetical protein
MAMTNIAKSINIAIAILLKRSIGIAINFAISTAIAYAIVSSSIAYNPAVNPQWLSGQYTRLRAR